MSALAILDIKKNSFQIRTENFNSVLSKVGNRPFALISINGATRTGKSFALNYFIRYLTFKTGNKDPLSVSSAESWPKLTNAPKFVARGGRTRTTLGIDLWSEPFIIQQDGREVAILVMDCQGLFDELTTGTQNAIIFSLSSLCSSISIFNLMRNIDESILQQIQFFSGYAHLVTQEKGTNGRKGKSERNPFQRLIFLLRDFEFDYDYGYHGDTKKSSMNDSECEGVEHDKNYCVATFYPPGGGKTPASNLFVREEILKSYKDVACFLMPHPGRQFIRDETKPTDEEFEAYMKQFVELVLSPQNLATKKIGGQEVTGNDFKKFIEEWAKLCENAEDRFPAVKTIAESTATIQLTLAHNTAFAHYEKAMRSFLYTHPRGLSDVEFLKLHEQLQSEALKIFNGSQKLGGKKLATQYEKSLVELIKKLYESSRHLNLILVSKAATDEELEKNKKKVSEFQNKLSDLETQNKRDKEQQDKVIGDLQKKMKEDSTANAEQQKMWQEQLAVAQNVKQQLSEVAESNKTMLTEQIKSLESKFEQRERDHENAIQEYQRQIEELKESGEGGGGGCAIL